MAATKMVVYVTTSARLPELPQNDGQVIFVRDTREIYMDWMGARVNYTVLQVIATEADRQMILSTASAGFYFVEGTGILWHYDGENWSPINEEVSPLYFGGKESFPAVGQRDMLYITDNAIYKWIDATQEYMVVSNKTDWNDIEEG